MVLHVNECPIKVVFKIVTEKVRIVHKIRSTEKFLLLHLFIDCNFEVE